MISGTTRTVGIIGWPVTYSLSPAIHNAAFAALGLDMAYVALPVAPDGVADAVRGLRALGFRGANVTMPHKAAVIALLDEVSDEARAIEAVNTIVVDDDALRGYNTDVGGFVRALRDAIGSEPLGGAAGLVLGAGGAAHAVVLGLARQGVRQFTIANRTVERAQELTRRLEGVAADLRFAVVALDALEPNHVAQADIVVNATSLGMVGALKVPDVLVDNIRRDHVVCDVVYGQRPTKPLEQARLLGARVVDGLGMLTWQAALAFELWTGRRAPLEVMRSAAR